MTEPNSHPAPVLEEQLIAYLDGELPADDARALERRLSEDADLRRRLHQHQQLWDMIDELPRSQVRPEFPRTTVEMIAVHVAADVETAQRRQSDWKHWRWAGGVAATLLAAVLGYVAIGGLLPDPNERLARDLPILEKLDAYRNADSVEFLRALEAAGLFQKEPGDEL